MRRRNADVFVAGLVGVVLVFGGLLTWQAYQQRQAAAQMAGGMMGGSSMMSGMYGTDPVWYAFGTLLAAGVVAGGYLVVRLDATAATETASATGPTEFRSEPEPGPSSNGSDDEGEPAPGVGAERTVTGGKQAAAARRRVLDVLPEDERRVLEPVIESPGVTQIELRDRSEFSKSKVSQTVSDLEKRGLLYRERQGRTYRVYPSDELTENGQ